MVLSGNGQKKPWLRHSQDKDAVTHENESDLAAQLFAYLRFRSPKNMPSEQALEDSGIVAANFQRAYELELIVRRRVQDLSYRRMEYEMTLADIFGRINLVPDLERVSCSSLHRGRRDLNLCLVKAFAPHLYFRSWGGDSWRGAHARDYQLSKSSVLHDNSDAQLVVALPRAVENEVGERRLWLDFATAVTPVEVQRASHTGNSALISESLKAYAKFLQHDKEREPHCRREGAGRAGPIR